MQFTAHQIAQLVGGTIEGDPSVMVHNVGKIESAQAGDFCFLGNLKYEDFAYTTKASILLISNDFEPKSPIQPTLIRVADVYTTMAKLLDFVGKTQQEAFAQSATISKKSSIGNNVKLGNDVNIGDFTIIEENVIIGKDTYISPQVFIGVGTIIGDNCTIHAGVKIYPLTQIGNNCIIHANAVIGADGFGFAPEKDGTYSKITHIGNVVLEDNVEIGANTTIDKGSIGSTILRKGAKLDNLIQVAHNVEIGENTVIAAQTGIAGSTKVGKNCQIGGQVGIVGHITIADGTKIQAQSGINRNTQPDDKLYGSPAISYNNFLRAYTVFKKLPDWAHKLDILWNERK
jgi:UDP-3-O-[3-hydroxymyristoyl] glucosamine N-acyltransferase